MSERVLQLDIGSPLEVYGPGDIYLNEINRYLIPNIEFSVSITGVTILLGGFDASTGDYNLVIEKYYS